MTASQLPLALAQRHHNRQLFADRYLDETLPRRDAWLALIAEAAPVLARVRAILAAFTPSTNEAQTERDLVRPVLEALGHTFEVQAALRTPKGTKKPDYLFYRDVAAQNANKGRTLTDADLAAAFAIGDAKYWERKLDVSTPSGDEDLSRVPADQIAFYMRHSGTPWGILTNGRRWRLYHHESVERQDRYYEVDLKDLADAGESAAFLYFYAFFRRGAFEQPVGETLTLDGMLRESVDYARGVSKSLKAQVFDALRHLAQGFLDYPRNGLQPTPETLREIYANSLIVLYRLLFVLYAEARELLPLRESPAYRDEYSLYAVVREAARRLDSGTSLLADTGRTWAKLRDLFSIINEGNPPLKVATFNGGLFDPQRHTFLERHTVGDAQLQLALDKLARVVSPRSGAKEFIDYRDLAERHLGTIYEGLLEYHLQPTPRTADGFTTEIVNDKGERHRTGSYYTPDFVVQYIVEQTLRPVLDAAVAGKTTDAEKTAAVLGVNCIDPAMGSGHFPVAAMEYIARYLVELAVAPPDNVGDEPDLAYWKRRVAQSCIYGVDLNPLAVDLAKLSLWLATAAKGRPLSFLDHHLRCGNALVGARASELDGTATPAKKAKRSKKETAAAEAGQLSLLDDAAFAGAMSSAVGSMWLIEGSAGRTVDEVKEQERIYETVRAGLTERFAVTADLVTSAGFGAAPERGLWRALAEYATKRDAGAFATPAFERPMEQVRQIKAAQRFFHWDLEFPEVFYDRHGRPKGEQGGFDAVVGNPPYVRQEQLAPIKPYLQGAYPETYSGTADLFVYFFQQGMKLMREGGRLGYIASNSWLRANYATPLRAFMRSSVTVEQLIDLGDNRVFADAPDVYPAIPIVRKATPPEDHTAQAAVFNRGEGLKEFELRIAAKLAPVSIHDQQDTGWQLGAGEGRELFAKMLRQGKPFGEVVQGQFFFGIKTGYNQAFIIDHGTRNKLVAADARSAEIIKPIVRGEDLRPWYFEEGGEWIIFARRGVNIDAYPAIKSHLEQYHQRLEPKPKELEENAPWAGRKAGAYRWFELQDTVEYFEAFHRPKILWPDIAKFPRFSWDTEARYPEATTFCAPCNDPYLLGILQSRVSWFCISNLCHHLGERAGMVRYRLKSQYMINLPIPDAPESERQAVGDLAMKITEEAKARYKLHQRARSRIVSDLGVPGKALNQKLTAWWTLDFPAFREELRKVFKREIAVKERDDWEEWLTEQRRRHEQHTAAIIAGETELNARVYQLFDLNADEIRLIEESTKYKYGEV